MQYLFGFICVLALVVMGCSGGGGSGYPPLPNDLPEYEPSGQIGPASLFGHGVASGDPTADAVVIWTRVSPEVPESTEVVKVFWEMALDQDFQKRTAAGTATTDAARDFTVKVDVAELKWGRTYYYRFALDDRWSAIGRTRLAPQGAEVDQLRFAVCVGSSYARGYYHGFRHIAARADLDAVLHLGDYYYEYGNDTYEGEELIRPLEPPHEAVTRDDYRTRLSQARRDPDLQEVHRQHPFIWIWDDHETANNSWVGGAQNHDPDEGPWEDRVAAATQALFEWMPIRDDGEQRIYRAFEYGDLADVIMLDTRLEGREEQLDAEPTLIFTPGDPALPDRIMSATQENWLQTQLANSSARWKIIGNQVAVSGWQFVDGVTGEVDYFNTDQWHGYPGSRGRLMTFLREDDPSNVVFVSGDFHTSIAMDVTFDDGSYDLETQEGAVAVEFVTPAVTTPPAAGRLIVEVVNSHTPHVRYSENTRAGYMLIDVKADKVQADWYLLDGVDEDEGNESLDASWAVRNGEKHVIEMEEPEAPQEEPPPLAE